MDKNELDHNDVVLLKNGQMGLIIEFLEDDLITVGYQNGLTEDHDFSEIVSFIRPPYDC